MLVTVLFAAVHLTGTQHSLPCRTGSVGHKADHFDHMRACGDHPTAKPGYENVLLVPIIVVAGQLSKSASSNARTETLLCTERGVAGG